MRMKAEAQHWGTIQDIFKHVLVHSNNLDIVGEEGITENNAANTT